MKFVSSKAAVEYLLSTNAIRERSRRVLEFVENGDSPFFTLHRDQLSKVVSLVVEEIKHNYPKLDVPYHSRWRHFSVGGIDREAVLDRLLNTTSRRQAVMAKLELAIVSVLLDAGAGSTWRYREPEMGGEYSRSEGLAVASFHAFTCGKLGGAPLRVDAHTLAQIDNTSIEEMFQVSEGNPLLGASGRAELLRNLGRQIEQRRDLFPSEEGRLGGFLQYLLPEEGQGVGRQEVTNNRISAQRLLSFVLEALGPIWPGRLSLAGVPLGDVWQHPAIVTHDETNGFVPFHKLSQWLTYSLCEPLRALCGEIEGVEELTGLAEYRNGGLFVDGGVLRLKDEANYGKSHTPSSQLVVEWRACTICLLDEVAERVRAILGFSPQVFPLAKVLQGGTWSVGRLLAKQLRNDGGPPLHIESDGTVF